VTETRGTTCEEGDIYCTCNRRWAGPQVFCDSFFKGKEDLGCRSTCPKGAKVAIHWTQMTRILDIVGRLKHEYWIVPKSTFLTRSTVPEWDRDGALTIHMVPKRSNLTRSTAGEGVTETRGTTCEEGDIYCTCNRRWAGPQVFCDSFFKGKEDLGCRSTCPKGAKVAIHWTQMTRIVDIVGRLKHEYWIFIS